MVVKIDERETWRIRKGAAKTFLLTVKNADGTTRVLTGETILFSFRAEIGDSVQVISKTLNGSESGSVFASGIAALIFTSTDFASVTIPEGEWHTFLAFSATLTTSGGTPYAIEIGGRGAAMLELEQAA